MTQPVIEDLIRTGVYEPAAGPTAPGGAPAGVPPVLSEYDVVRVLGSGGMGIVYQAFDRKRGRMVALKTLKQIDPAALYGLKQEFRALTEVVHPNLVSYFELVAAEDQCFVTMEFLDGTDFLTHVRGAVSAPDAETVIRDSSVEMDVAAVRESVKGMAVSVERPKPGRQSPDMARLRAAFGQLATGVDAIHRMGKLHRDLKPSNVMVTKSGRVVILDFGLAAELDRSNRHQDRQIVGTLAYMAPEQAAAGTVSPASDWYSLGVMLYEALTGRHPFPEQGLQVLLQKQTSDAVPPGVLDPGIPEDLNELCVGLLSRSPAARPAGPDVLRRLAGESASCAVAPGAAAGDVSVLIGRHTQLERLRECYGTSRLGRPVATLVHGRSGVGKSRLIQHFLDELVEQHRAVVLSGKCYERESVPYKSLDSLIDALSRYLGTLSSEAVEAVLPREVHLLTRLFPVLNRVPAVARAPGSQVSIVDPLESRRRAFAGLRTLLARLGDRQPLVLFVDDLQWGDAESAAALADLLEPPDAPVFLLVGSYRSEELETSACLRPLLDAWEQVLPPENLCSLAVDPLTEAEAVELATELAASDPAARHRAIEIARESRGNPFFVQVLVQSIAEGGGAASVVSGEGVALDDVLWRRMQKLPAAARELLEAIAVSGQPLTISEASRAAGLSGEAHAVLAQLRYERMVRGTGAADLEEVETYHDRVRETILDRLEPADLRSRHLRLAVALEEAKAAADAEPALERAASTLARSQERRLFSLAYHFDAAGEGRRALPYALSAAAQARSRHALQIAEQQYRIAERGAATADHSTRYVVAEGLGEILMLRGNYAEAERSFQAAIELAPTTLAQAQTGGKLGEVAFKRGDLPGCSAAVEGALRLLGMYVPRRNWIFGLLVTREGIVQLLHTLFPKRFLGRRSRAGSEREFTAIRLYSRLGYCYWFLRGRIPCFWAHLRDMNLAECYPPSPELAQAYSEHGPGMGMIGMFDRGISYSQKSLAIRRELGDVWGQGQTLHFYCVVLYACGRFEECIERGREADRLLEQTGDPWERNSARYQVARSLYRLGRLAEAREVAWQFHQAALDLGDAQGAAMSLDVWTLASRGRVPGEVIQRELARPSDDVQRAAQVMLAEAVRLLAEHQPGLAVEMLESAVDRLRRGGITNAFVTPVYAWYATALRLQALTCAEGSSNRKLLLRKAQRAVRRASRLAKTFQNDLPHCRREAGLLAALQGRSRKSRQLLAESLEFAEQQGARFEAAETLACRARIGLQFGWSDAATDQFEARRRLESLGIAD